MDNKKVLNGSFAGVAVVVFLFMRHLADTLWGVIRLPMHQDWPFAPADLLAVIVAVAVFIVLKKQPKVNEFSDQVITELSKVTWPPRKETLLSTIVVVVMVAICAVILFGFDTLWGTLVKMLYQ